MQISAPFKFDLHYSWKSIRRKLWSEAETLPIHMPIYCSIDFRHADRQERKARGTNRLWAFCARPWTKSFTYSLTDPHSKPWGDTIIISILLMRKMRLREKHLVQGQEGLGLGDKFQQLEPVFLLHASPSPLHTEEQSTVCLPLPSLADTQEEFASEGEGSSSASQDTSHTVWLKFGIPPLDRLPFDLKALSNTLSDTLSASVISSA